MANEQMKEVQEEVKVATQEESPATAQEDGKGIPVKVNAGIKFTLLKNDFVVAFQKDGNVVSILLAPTNASEKNGMTIQEMVDEIKKLMGVGSEDTEVKGLEEQLQKTVKSVGKTEGDDSFKPMEITISLQQAFLYYRSETNGSEKTVKDLEYAFSLSVDMSKMLDKIDIFNLKEITLSVWKTDRKKVTESMNMFKIEDFLKEEA